MRVFVGIPVTRELAVEIHHWREKYPIDKMRWIADHNLHITLVPPWNVKDPQQTITLLEQASVPASFSLNFEEIRIGPDSRPRLMWAKAAMHKAIVQMRNDVHSALGQRIKARPFVPHVTLGRFRASELKTLSLPELPYPITWEMKVDQVALYESQLSPQGSEYQILSTFDLMT